MKCTDCTNILCFLCKLDAVSHRESSNSFIERPSVGLSDTKPGIDVGTFGMPCRAMQRRVISMHRAESIRLTQELRADDVKQHAGPALRSQ